MSTELISLEEIHTLIKINGYLKNITNNEQINFNTKAISTKQKISYTTAKEKYQLKIISPTQLIFIRENNSIINTIYFEKNKTLSSTYKLKSDDLTFNIDIKTISLSITNKFIKIIYLVPDSNYQYEYYLNRSDK